MSLLKGWMRQIWQRLSANAVCVSRYSHLQVDKIAGLDARGFILGPPIALALKKPFVMIRKEGRWSIAIFLDV